MGKWMGNHKGALIVSTIMFAFMAMFMMEVWLSVTPDPDFVTYGTKGDGIPQTVLWIWRLGGFLTWPVFIYMLLRPHLDKAKQKAASGQFSGNPTSIASIACIIAAVYGGGGLWLVDTITTSMLKVLSFGDQWLIFTPILAILLLVIPFAYLWGFVALYGFSRTKLDDTKDTQWIWPSVGAAIVGVFLIGILIYAAIAIVMIPILLIIGSASYSFDWTPAISQHLTCDLVAMAISSGNFASQWYGFKKVDEKLDPDTYGKFVPVPPATYRPPQPAMYPQRNGGPVAYPQQPYTQQPCAQQAYTQQPGTVTYVVPGPVVQPIPQPEQQPVGVQPACPNPVGQQMPPVAVPYTNPVQPFQQNAEYTQPQNVDNMQSNEPISNTPQQMTPEQIATHYPAHYQMTQQQQGEYMQMPDRPNFMPTPQPMDRPNIDPTQPEVGMYIPPVQPEPANTNVVEAAPAKEELPYGMWICPECGRTNDNKFCPECATPRPSV